MAHAAFILGPEFQLVKRLSSDDAAHRDGGAAGCFAGRDTPLVVSGLAMEWPLFDRWTFSRLSRLKSADGGALLATFQNGLVEQGATASPMLLPAAPYLRDLADAERANAEGPPRTQRGLIPPERVRTLYEDQHFHLNWAHMRSFQADRVYLAAWDVLRERATLRDDVAPLVALWRGRGRFLAPPRVRLYAGPSRTVSGLHAHPGCDTLAAQLRGVKEWLLFPPEAAEALRPTRKFMPGGRCAGVDISDLGASPAALKAFERAKGGLYVRCLPGDVLYVPAGWWHAAVSAEPSLTVSSSAALGALACGALVRAARERAHARGLLGKGWCTCHSTQELEHMDVPQEGDAAEALLQDGDKSD